MPGAGLVGLELMSPKAWILTLGPVLSAPPASPLKAGTPRGKFGSFCRVYLRDSLSEGGSDGNKVQSSCLCSMSERVKLDTVAELIRVFAWLTQNPSTEAQNGGRGF